jgi:hypothetical protein
MVAALAVCTCIVGWCSPAGAESGTVHTTFAAGTRMIVDTRWVDGAAYRPARITITPTAPTTTDKLFTVEFLFRRRYWSDDQYDLRVARDIELPAGSGPVRATVLLPRCPECLQYAINVLEDGEAQLGLCVGWRPFTNLQTDLEECLPVVLVVGDTIPDTGQLATLLPLENYNGSQAVRRFSRGPNRQQQFLSQKSSFALELPGLVVRPAAELPQRWIDYSNLDVVCLSLGQLEELADNNPSALEAVLHWTAAGGNLWVYAVGQDWQRVGRLEDLLGLPPGAAEKSDPVDRGWSKPDKNAYLRPVKGGFSEVPVLERRYVEVPGPDGTMVVSERDYYVNVQTTVGEAPAETHFLLRDYQMGLVAALASGDPFPGTTDEWRGLLNAMGRDRWLWYRRHGLSMLRKNQDYWNFLIPGIGLVPVIEFCVLITVFATAIGPLNYWILRRLKRLYLLVLTIPLGAATVTLVLFGYAFLADGLGTRVRVRSVTQLDQSRGQAACWARMSYYAGLAPRRGLAFPDDVAVLPLEFFPVPDYRQGPLRREVIWEETEAAEQQQFASGWLNSRTPMQLLTVRSRPSRLGLELIRSAAQPDGLRVKNRLGTRIEQVVIRTDEENYYWAEGVDADEIVALQQFTPEARRKLWQRFQENLPRKPEGMQTRYYGYSSMFGLRYYRGRYGNNPALTPPTQKTGRLETSLADLFSLGSGGLSVLQPDSYVAVVEKCPEVVPGVASAREEASYHVIWGKW